MSRILPHEPLYGEVLHWYIEEAEELDHGRFKAWLARMNEAIDYRMPVRTTVMREDGDGISKSNFHFEEDIASLRTRIRRLADGASTWAENPASRTRRFVSNLRLEADGGDLAATTNLFVTRSRGDASAYELISCERRDRLRRTAEGLKLAERTIIADQALLGVVNLAIML